MRKLLVVGLTVAVVGLVFAGIAQATSLKGRLGLRPYGGQSWINPRDYNDMMEEGKEWFEDEGAKTELQKLENTTLFGGDLRYGLTDNLVLAAGYLSDSGKGMLKGTHTNLGTESFTIEEQFQMTGYTLGFNYTVIDPPGLNIFLVGGAGSYILKLDSTGSGDWDIMDPWDETGESESTIGYHGGLGLQWFLSPQVALDLEALYRSLVIPDFPVDEDSMGFDLDFSGLIGILSLTFYL